MLNTMSTMVCRLCLNEQDLINIFHNRLTEFELLRMCILLGTGVTISRDDTASKYICRLCSDIVMSMYKYRQNAIANDKALKESANQQYSQPLAHTQDIFEFNLEVFYAAVNVEQEINNDFECTPKTPKKPQTDLPVHPTIINLFKKHPKIKIPNDLLKYDLQPKIFLDKNEVNRWKPPPKLEATPVSKPINNYEMFKMKFPHINIAKLSSSNERKGDSVKLENIRKRKVSDASSVSSSNESQSANKKKKFTEHVSSEDDRISKSVDVKIVSQSKPKIEESKTKTVNLSEFKTNRFNSHVSEVKITNLQESKVKTTISHEPKIKTNNSHEPKVKTTNSHESKIKTIISQESKVKTTTSHEPKIKTTNAHEPKVKTTNSHQPKVKTTNSHEHKGKITNLREFRTKTPNLQESKVKVTKSHESKIKSNSIESNLRTSDLRVKLSEPNSVKDINDSKVINKESQHTSNIISPVKSVPKLKITLRKSTEEPTTKGTLSPVTASSVTSKNKFLSITTVQSPSKTTPSVSQVDNQVIETDSEKIIPKKLSKNTLFDSDTDLSDVDSIGANDMPLDECLLDTVEEELAFPCSLCNKIFTTSFQLKCHERTHKTCTICKLICRSNETLRHHHKEVCFKTVIANPPDVQLIRVDEEPEILKQYSKAFTSDTTTNDDTNTNVSITNDDTIEILSISDEDDDDEVILVGESTDDIDLTKSQELKYVCKVFSKYKAVNIPGHTKTRYSEMKPQMKVSYNSKNQIVLQNMYPELRNYRVPVELLAKSSQFAYISFSRNPTPKKEIFSWVDMPITKLSEKSLLNSLATQQNPKPKTIQPLSNAFVNAQQVTTKISTTTTTTKPGYQNTSRIETTTTKSSNLNDSRSSLISNKSTSTNQAQQLMDEDIMELLEESYPIQQPVKESISLRVKTPWELNNI